MHRDTITRFATMIAFARMSICSMSGSMPTVVMTCTESPRKQPPSGAICLRHLAFTLLSLGKFRSRFFALHALIHLRHTPPICDCWPTNQTCMSPSPLHMHSRGNMRAGQAQMWRQLLCIATAITQRQVLCIGISYHSLAGSLDVRLHAGVTAGRRRRLQHHIRCGIKSLHGNRCCHKDLHAGGAQPANATT